MLISISLCSDTIKLVTLTRKAEWDMKYREKEARSGKTSWARSCQIDIDINSHHLKWPGQSGFYFLIHKYHGLLLEQNTSKPQKVPPKSCCTWRSSFDPKKSISMWQLSSEKVSVSVLTLKLIINLITLQLATWCRSHLWVHLMGRMCPSPSLPLSPWHTTPPGPSPSP